MDFQERKDHYRILAEVSPMGIFHADVEGKLHYVNDRWCSITGMTADDAYAKGLSCCLHPDDLECVLDEWCNSAGEHAHVKLEFRIVHPDGSIKWVYGQIESVLDGQSELVGYVGTLTDISDLKSVEKTLLDRNEFIETILNNLPIGLAVISQDDRKVLYMNEMLETIVGWPKDVIVDEDSFWTYCFPDPVQREKEKKRQMEDAATGDASRMIWEYSVTRQSGKQADLLTVDIPLMGQNIVITTIQDVTELKKAEQFQAQLQMAAEVQSKLLPLSMPEVSGFEIAGRCIPAYQVGGDFFDCYYINDEMLSLTLGDVMGKGLPAALLMATVRSALRALSLATSSSRSGKLRFRTAAQPLASLVLPLPV